MSALLCAFVAGVCFSVLFFILWIRLRTWAFRFIADRDTGEKRRARVPPHIDVSATYLDGCVEFELATSKELRNERGFHTLRSGQNIFWQLWTPPSGEVKAVVVFFHGFGDHCDFQMALKAKALCNLGPFAAMSFDLPGHGRSDGLHVHVPDWFTFVDAAREVCEDHFRPMAEKRWPGARRFGFGVSMGGGLLFTLLARERELFHGAIFVCPMLFVSDDLMPPWIVVQVFKYILVKLLPLWPVAPSKDIQDFCSKDPNVQHYQTEAAPYHTEINYRGQPRLITAFQLAFVACAWMRERIPSFDTPSLIIHGAGDVITDPQVSKELFAKMKNEDKESLFPDGVWHADLFVGGPTMREGVRERFEATAAWIKKRC